EDLEILGQLQRVRAQVDVLAQLEHPRDDVLDPLVDQRLAAADRNHGRGALDAGVDALVHREARLVRFVLADLPAADAGEVAGERRLEHQDERVALSISLLRGDVAADLDGRTQRELHVLSLSLRRPSAMSGKWSR